jgi:hypothetical protein
MKHDSFLLALIPDGRADRVTDHYSD